MSGLGDLDTDNLGKQKQPKDILTASGIAEYIRFNCCPRFFKLRLDEDDLEDDELSQRNRQFEELEAKIWETREALQKERLESVRQTTVGDRSARIPSASPLEVAFQSSSARATLAWVTSVS